MAPGIDLLRVVAGLDTHNRRDGMGCASSQSGNCAKWPYRGSPSEDTIAPTNRGFELRLLVIGLLGGAIAAVAFLATGSTTGFLQAGLFIAAVCCGTLTLGALAIVIVERIEDRLAHRKYRADVGISRSSSRDTAPTRTRCGVCNRAMQQLESIWVCSMCDRSFSHL